MLLEIYLGPGTFDLCPMSRYIDHVFEVCWDDTTWWENHGQGSEKLWCKR